MREISKYFHKHIHFKIIKPFPENTFLLASLHHTKITWSDKLSCLIALTWSFLLQCRCNKNIKNGYVLASGSSTHLDDHYLRHVQAGSHSNNFQWVSVCYFYEARTNSDHQCCTTRTLPYILSVNDGGLGVCLVHDIHFFCSLVCPLIQHEYKTF